MRLTDGRPQGACLGSESRVLLRWADGVGHNRIMTGLSTKIGDLGSSPSPSRVAQWEEHRFSTFLDAGCPDRGVFGLREPPGGGRPIDLRASDRVSMPHSGYPTRSDW